MDAYSPTLIALGQRGMIGKGKRSPEVIAAMKEHGAVYFGAIGGAARCFPCCIKKAEIIAYEDLGAEALRRPGGRRICRPLSSSTARATTCMKPEEKSISNRSGKIIR